jgi:uracil-DNA glycosylase family 4
MNSIQLSLFSDNMPDKDLEEANKKKKHTDDPVKSPEAGTDLPAVVQESENQQTEESNPDTKNEVPVETITEKFNSPAPELPQTSKTQKKKQKELSAEDIAIEKISEAMEEKVELTDGERLEYLAEIRQIGLNCHKCRLAETRTKVVFGAGNPDAPIMIIGEGPGEQEDKSGIPFVGRAGQLLDKIMESANIHRDRDVYITNVVKCRPPENRAPLPDETEACSVYLEKQLELAKASIILLTGATAMKAILNSSSSISKIRGEWIQWNGKWVMPIFHPSYLLRNQSKEVGSPKWLMWQDIKKVKQKFDEIKETENDI